MENIMVVHGPNLIGTFITVEAAFDKSEDATYPMVRLDYEPNKAKKPANNGFYISDNGDKFEAYLSFDSIAKEVKKWVNKFFETIGHPLPDKVFVIRYAETENGGLEAVSSCCI